MASLTEWKVPSAVQPRPEDYSFDLERTLSSVVGLHSIIPADAFTADTLGTERAGNGVVIDDGLILTIGYLITEAETVWLHLADGGVVQGHALGFDQDSGFGLVQALEHNDLELRLHRLAELAERSCDLARIQGLAAPLRAVQHPAVALPPPGQRIALASDAAFAFVYPHVLSGWRRAGAEIIAFSPLAGEPPPEHCDSCWLPGGYPELHAGTLANAARFIAGLKTFAARCPIHGECGGYMVLGQGLVDAKGTRHAMVGLLSHATSFAERRLHLGYRAVTLLQDCPLGAAGARLRGHEFHYATLTDPGRDGPLRCVHTQWCRKLPAMKC